MFTLAPIWFPHWPACKCKISLMTMSVSRVATTVVIETWFVAVDVVRPRCSRSVCSLHTAADATATARQPRRDDGPARYPPFTDCAATTDYEWVVPLAWLRGGDRWGGRKSPHVYALMRTRTTAYNPPHPVSLSKNRSIFFSTIPGSRNEFFVPSCYVRFFLGPEEFFKKKLHDLVL